MGRNAYRTLLEYLKGEDHHNNNCYHGIKIRIKLILEQLSMHFNYVSYTDKWII